MNTNRRRFLSSAAAIGGASALLPLTSCSPKGTQDCGPADYSALDAALAKLF